MWGFLARNDLAIKKLAQFADIPLAVRNQPQVLKPPPLSASLDHTTWKHISLDLNLDENEIIPNELLVLNRIVYLSTLFHDSDYFTT